MTRAIGALALSLVLSLALGACGGDDGRRKAHSSAKKLIVLGVDGMDPGLVRQYMAAGKLPNLTKLSKQGGFAPLGTSNPPQSPVAWSNVITGADSRVHGIYDFVHRDPTNVSPYLSTSRTEAAEELNLLGLTLSVGSAETKLLRRGDAYWNILDRAGVPATVVKMPAEYPPGSAGDNEVLSGMGTPDIMGTYGIFQVLTDDPARIERGNPSSGIVHALDFGSGQRASTVLDGPPDPGAEHGEAMTLPTQIVVDRKAGAAMVAMGDARVLLSVGEWSPWTPIGFDVGLIAGSLPGMVRLYLKSVEPHVTVYVSPINLDPIDPLQPISSPESYAKYLAVDAGRFYTQGMPEDTKALAADVLSDDEFLAQGEIIFDESVRQLDRELARFDGGLLFYYFSSVDQTSHVFWRALEPDANEHDRQYAHVIPQLYDKVDAVVGQVMARMDPEATLIVMSDHGFNSYRRKVHLNTWLANRGYLALLPPGATGRGALPWIDWDNTQAYALGLNQVFVNLAGRETWGAVSAADREPLLDRLARDLEGMRDPETGATVITRVYRPDATTFFDRAPDLLIGYARGYRSSDESATGLVGNEVITRNSDKWSGDHCIDPSHVPGVLLSSAPLSSEPVSLVDIAPTILTYFGIEPPAQMEGTSALAR